MVTSSDSLRKNGIFQCDAWISSPEEYGKSLGLETTGNHTVPSQDNTWAQIAATNTLFHIFCTAYPNL